MMLRAKNTLLLLIVQCVFIVSLSAQNLQLHYDARHTIHGDQFPRNFARARFEMFKPDSLGMTTVFFETAFSGSKNEIGMAFLMLSRDLVVSKKTPLMLHIEYNGGIAKVETTGFSMPNAYIAGISYINTLGALNFTTYVAYRHNAFEKASHDLQWALMADIDLLNDKLSLQSWLNTWTENKIYERKNFKPGKYVIFLFEQQIWYNFTPHLALGGQLEFSNNFYHHEIKPYINPTLAARWNF